jgi:multiple sugar transport system substrate-binding protein
MRYTKLAFVILMGLVSGAALFAAGGSQAASPGASVSKDIELWMINNPNAPIIKAFDDAGKNFEAAAGIKVNYVRTPTNDFHTKLVTSISAKVYPDMIIWNISPGIEFSGTGMVVTVDDLVNEIGRGKFADGDLRMLTLNGKLYEIPFLTRPSGLHARKSWLQKAGYDTTLRTDAKGQYYMEGLRTWEDILEAGKKITDVSNGKYGLGFAYSRKAYGDSAGFCAGVLACYGSRVLDDNGKAAINSPETIAGLAFLKRFWESGAIPPAATTWDGNSNNQFFIAGDVGIVSNSNSIFAGIKSDSPIKADDVVIIPFPSGPKGAFKQSHPDTITIFKTPKVEYAREYARYLLKTETQIEMFRTMGYGYYSPVRNEIMQSELFRNLSDNEKVMAADGAKSVDISYPGDPNPVITALYSSFMWDDALSRIAVDNWTPEQIAAEMEKKVKEAFE